MTEIHFTGTLYYNYALCSRKAWLMYYQIEPEHEHDLLDQGRLNQLEHYERSKKEWELPGIHIDQIRQEGDEWILSEVKKSSSGMEASILQLSYYLSRVEEEGMKAKGEVLIPKERERVEVILDDHTKAILLKATADIEQLLSQQKPPNVKWLKICPNCAYSEFCWSGQETEE
jgi:CRISPR-associated exonuclease Cas4